MALLECYARYLAMRPISEHSPSLSFKRMIILIEITFCLASFSNIIDAATTNDPTPWPSIQLPSGIDKIVADEKDGSVFFTINNDIYKYDKELMLVYQGSLSTSSKVIDVNETNSLNKILTIARRNNQDLLFSCWQNASSHLGCWLNKVNDLGAKTPLIWSVKESKGFKTDTKEDMQALINPADPNDYLFLTSRFEIINTTFTQARYLPAIARFYMTKSPKHLSLEQKSVLQYNSPSSDHRLINGYVHAFYYKQNTYIILNEYQEPVTATNTKDARNINVRIAKICNNDMDLTSYTEISMTCNNANNIMAKSAYLNVSKEEPLLYTVFEFLNEPSTKKASEKSSILCSYSMQLVEDLFNKAISECNNGYEASSLLAKFSPPSTHPSLCSRNPSQPNEWCTSKANPYIDGTSRRYNLREDTYVLLNGVTAINFLHLIEQGPDNREVLFIGSSSGHLTKMNLEEDLFYTINLNTNQIRHYRMGEKAIINSSDESQIGDIGTAKYTVSNRNITAITRAGKVNQLDIDACYYYTTCHACLSTRDPLECVWCVGSCSKRNDCDKTSQSAISCPPIIKNFSPKKATLMGETRLRIEGENFGTSKGRLSVKLNDEECLVDRATSSSETIECLIKPRNQPSNVSLSVNVTDESGYIYSKGATVAMEPLYYANVTIFGLEPASGPQAGGSPINIYGSNLDAGANRSVMIGDVGCDITSVQPDKISCLTKSWSHQNISNSSAISQPLKVLIDGSTQLFEIRPSIDGHKLSTNFVYITEHLQSNGVLQVNHMEESQDVERYPIFSILIIIGLLLGVALVFYTGYIGNLRDIRTKLSSKSVGDAKVSFKNPDSHQFLEAGDSSINGLVKLNGSMMSSGYFGRPDQFEQDQPLMSNIIDKDLLSLLVKEKILIDRNRLTLGHVLGSGQFGRVYKGFFKVEDTGEHMAVAVKTLHSKSSWDDSSDNRAFLEEGLMMKDFEHENVLALIGVTFDLNGLPMVITPFMLYGDLRSYISDEASSPSVKELIDFGTQVARGMAYLAHSKFVHRDLAARNCMLDENLVVKVADFGLSRDIYECDYFSDNKKTKLPVKWMAIESLEKSVYNTKTDVWSYGVLLWELMTRGVMPYPDVDNFDLFSYLKEGRRMLRPRYCPVILYKIMLSCWDENPANRPTFDQLVQQVSDVIMQLKIAKEGQQKVSRDATYGDALK